MSGIVTRYYILTTDTKPATAVTNDELVVLDATTGEVDSFWIYTTKTNPITSDRWWKI